MRDTHIRKLPQNTDNPSVRPAGPDALPPSHPDNPPSNVPAIVGVFLFVQVFGYHLPSGGTHLQASGRALTVFLKNAVVFCFKHDRVSV